MISTGFPGDTDEPPLRFCDECAELEEECTCPKAHTPAIISKEAEAFIAFQAGALVRGLSCAEVDSFSAEIAYGNDLFEVTVTKLD